ncbi:hypothetical protein N7494_002789 [Penicillium frequentans]|uniref:Uncharacterized protein n=1 Tax=Penicillium frequentans TaxID=3151616 RepID=A0AAD6D4B3_9EURO|nr:hypothetical protein N7494_002789 [Penicillium glabrum]
MPCQAPHDQAETAFHTALISVLYPMGLVNSILHWGSATLTNKDGSRKAADGGWSPRGTLKRPSVVLEVAWSDTSAKLRRDCQYWVDPLKGEANMAIGIKIHKNAPHITFSQWEWNPELSRAIQTSCLNITKSDDGIQFNPQATPQLVIPFHLFFRRPAENSRERDLIFRAQDLIELATEVWDEQYHEQE